MWKRFRFFFFCWCVFVFVFCGSFIGGLGRWVLGLIFWVRSCRFGDEFSIRCFRYFGFRCKYFKVRRLRDVVGKVAIRGYSIFCFRN